MAPHTDIQVCAALLARLRPLFERATQALAQSCAETGVFDARRFDARQVASYELAWASADLLAAETAIQGVGSGANALETGLALIFGIDAIAAVLARTEMLFLELGLELAPVQALASDPAWNCLAPFGRQCRRLAGDRPGAWRTRRATWGACVLDEAHAMAQRCLRALRRRRGGAAGRGHPPRDLTVPESCCSRCARWACSACRSRAVRRQRAERPRHTLLMVLVTEALSEGSLAARRQPDHAARDPERAR
jgi:(2S)-methylsuccinyl-CoA dehydrogenase